MQTIISLSQMLHGNINKQAGSFKLHWLMYPPARSALGKAALSTPELSAVGGALGAELYARQPRPLLEMAGLEMAAVMTG